MKGAKKSRLAERINRSRQLRNQMNSNSSSKSAASATSVTDNMSLRSEEEDPTPPLVESMSVPEERSTNNNGNNMEGEDISSLQTSKSFAASRSARAKRHTLVEKRRKAMQRVRQGSPRVATDEAEEKKMEVEQTAKPPPAAAAKPAPVVKEAPPQSALPPPPPPPPVPSVAPPPLPQSRPRSMSRDRRRMSPLTTLGTSPTPQPPTAEPHRRFAIASEAAAPNNNNNTSMSEVNSDVNTSIAGVSETSTSVSAVLNKAWGDEFAPAPTAPSPVRPRAFEPLHKQYQKGRQQPQAAAPIRAEAPPANSQSRGRTLLVSNALKKRTPQKIDEEPNAELEQAKNEPEQLPPASGPQKMESTRNRHGANSILPKPVGSVVTPAKAPSRSVAAPAESEPTAEESETEIVGETKEPPPVSVSAMKARYGRSGVEKPAPPVPPQQPRRNTPSWVNRVKVGSPPPTEEVQGHGNKEEDHEQPQPMQVHQKVEPRRVRSASPSWVNNRGLSPVPRPAESRPVASSSPSWAKPKLPPQPEQSQPARAKSPVVVPPAFNNGVSLRNVSASPVPRSKAVVSAPSWVKRPGSPSTVAQEEAETASASLPISSKPVARNTGAAPWANRRAPSPQPNEPRRVTTTTPSWVKARSEKPEEMASSREPTETTTVIEPQSSSTNRSSRTQSWLEKRQQAALRTSLPEQAEQAEVNVVAPTNVQVSQGGEDLADSRTVSWLQKRRKGAASPKPPMEKEEMEQTAAPAAPMNAQQPSGGSSSRTLNWLNQRKQGVVSPQPLQEEVGAEETAAAPSGSQPLRGGGSSRTLNWLNQRKQGGLGPQPEKEEKLPEPEGPSSLKSQSLPAGGSNRTASWLQQKKRGVVSPPPMQQKESVEAAAAPVLPNRQRMNSPQPVSKGTPIAQAAEAKTQSWVNQRGLSPVTTGPRSFDPPQRVEPSWAKRKEQEQPETGTDVPPQNAPHPVAPIAASSNKAVAPPRVKKSENTRPDTLEEVEPEPVESLVGGSIGGESDEPSRFASAYVQRVVSKPAAAIKPQVRKETPNQSIPGGWPSAAQKPALRKDLPATNASFRPSQSPWSRYNPSEDSNNDFEAGSLASTVPPPPPASPPPSSVQEGPIDEFTPSHLRARFKALDQRNTGGRGTPNFYQSSTLSTPPRTKNELGDENLSQYDDPPLTELSDTETDIAEEDASRRVVIETPEKVSVSAMAGRFGVQRGKEPKKTPPRVVRPNDYWRSPDKRTPEPPSLAKKVQQQPQRRALAPPTWPTKDRNNARSVKDSNEYADPFHLSIQELAPPEDSSDEIESPSRLQSRPASDETKKPLSTTPPRRTPNDEMPSWLKKRMEEEVIVTNAQPMEQPTAQDQNLESRGDEPPAPHAPESKVQPKKDEELPWWLRPKERDEGIKKVFERAVSPVPIGERETDFVIEEQTAAAPHLLAHSEQASERRRRLDDLMRLEATSSSENEMDAGFAPQRERSSGPGDRRVGVIESWHARSRQDNADKSSPLEENPLKQNVEDIAQVSRKDDTSKVQSARSHSPELTNRAENTWLHEEENEFSSKVEWPHQRDNVPAYSRPVPQFEDEEEYPEVSPKNISHVSDALSNVAPQPWRASEAIETAAELSGSPNQRKPFERNFGSPGMSPLKSQNAKSGRAPSYQVPLVCTPPSSPKQIRQLGLPALSPEKAVNKSTGAPFDESMVAKTTRAPFDESMAANEDSSDLVIVESKKQEPRKKQQGRFALIRATASVDSIELEPIGGTYFGNGEDDELDEADADQERHQHQHPWEKDMNTLSPRTWQKRHPGENTAPMAQNATDSDDNAEEKKSTQGDEVASGTLSPNSLSRMAADSIHAVDYNQAVRALEPKRSVSYDDERSGGTDGNIPAVLPPEFANSLSKGAIHEASDEAASDVVFGEPMTYGAAGGDNISHEAPAVADRAKAIEDWKGGHSEKPREQERNRFFFPDSGRGGQEIFKDPPKAFGFEDVSENSPGAEDDLPKGARGASAVLRFWRSTSKDELDEAQDWKDLDPDVDNYSDTIVEDDSPEKIRQTSRLISTMDFNKQDVTAANKNRNIRRCQSDDDFDPGAQQPGKSLSNIDAPQSRLEPDPFSLDVVAALNTMTPKSKKSSNNAFDPFGDSIFGESVDFGNGDPEGLFAPSSASDLSSKKNLPTLAGSKKDTRPINHPASTSKKPSAAAATTTAPSATTTPARAATPTRTDTGLLRVLGTPPRSPTRRPMNVNQIQQELDGLAPSHEDDIEKVLSAPSVDDSLFVEEQQDEFSPKNDKPRNINDSIWSFDQGLPSYDHQDPLSMDRYDADVETFDMTTLDDSHPCEI